MLAGEIATARGNVADAERALRAAVRHEDALSYNEPPPWFLPVRQLLGALLLADGVTPVSEIVFALARLGT